MTDYEVPEALKEADSDSDDGDEWVMPDALKELHR
jgi:hypothetical protein